MIDDNLRNRFRPVARRIRIRRVWLTLAMIWSVAAVAAIMYLSSCSADSNLAPLPWIFGAGIVAATLIGFVWAARPIRDIVPVARKIENRFADLDATLLTAIEQRPTENNRYGFLQQDVMRRAIVHSYHNTWKAIVPMWQMLAAPIVSLLMLAALVATMIYGPAVFQSPRRESTIAFDDAVIEQRDFRISVEPGDVEIEKGTNLLVLARFDGGLPPEATLVYEPQSEKRKLSDVEADADSKRDPIAETSQLPMAKSLDDPVFGARIPAVSHPMIYRVNYGDQASPDYHVTVFEFPRLIRSDVELTLPAYTKLEPKKIQDVRRVTAVRGTRLKFSFFVNKPLASARLVSRDGETVELKTDPVDERKLTAEFQLDESRKYELKLVDRKSRANRTAPRFVLTAIENRPPTVQLTTPARDVQVSSIEELQLRASAWDDFGLGAMGFSYRVAGGDESDVVLQETAEAKKRHAVSHLLELEDLRAKPDELLTYYFWAEDTGPDGKTRRVSSDMFFAEVRHFEEIFRQGQQPAGNQGGGQQGQQGGQNAQQAQQLADLQKQIINATWKLIRRETNPQPSEKFADDSALLVESQQSAANQLEQLSSQLQDPASQSFVDTVSKYMNEALEQLTRAHDSADVEALQPALASEQAAYQGLLKMRAREHEVVRARAQQMQGQQSGNAGNRAQGQLNQLNLENDENRYENQRLANESQQSPEAREDRQVLNRLRELAQRQNDLNERVKELQSALEEAATEEEKREIERRLKTLREQQQQMLRDADELLDRMQQPENQQRMAGESEQLQQARDNIQQATEALEQGKTTRAAAEGTRAERELSELRDEFQNRTAGQFTQQMREMRNRAQEIEKQQQEITENLTERRDPSGDRDAPSLRPEPGQSDLTEQLAQQQKAVEDIRQQMRETIEEAEPFEPLLARELYETYRDSEVNRPDRALESVRESLDRGWVDDARNEERRASEGIRDLREGIENAAESVLGDETEALRIARNTLQDLNEELQREMQRESPDPANESPDTPPNNSQDPSERAGDAQRQTDIQQTEPKNDSEQSGGESTGRQLDQSRDKPQRDENAPAGQGSGRSDQRTGDRTEDRAKERGSGDRQPGTGRALRDEPRDAKNRPDPGGDIFDATGGGNIPMFAPITGDDFREWSDRLRDVEEMIADPELRGEAARIRDNAKAIRKDINRHSAEPNWDLIRMKVARPLVELQNRVVEELMRRNSRDALIPLDRDPVPVRFQESVRRYYERLGSGK